MAKKFPLIYIFAIFVIAAICIAAFFYSINSNNVIVEGVLVSSTSAYPFAAFSSLSKSSSFIVSPQMHEPVGSLEQYMFNGAALFIQVLQGNQKEIVQVIRVFNSQTNEMIYCSTNFGDVRREERLGVQECNDLLGSGGKTVVLIQFPDNSQWQPVIELGGKKITIKPKSYEGIGSTCFLALRIMYTNAGDIIDASNLIVGRINQSASPNGTDLNSG